MPVNGEPLVRRVIRWLATAGIRDLVLNLHHRPQSIAAVVGDGTRPRRARALLLGAAGARIGGRAAARAAAADRRADDDFLIVNGDTLTDVDVGSLVERHRRSGALVTMALIPNPRPDQYGGVRVIDGWLGDRLHACGGAGTADAARFTSSACRSREAEAFADLADGVPAESVNALYPQLIAGEPAQRRRVSSRSASFLDIGTPRDCLDTSLALAVREGAALVGRATRAIALIRRARPHGAVG